jgi:HPt (histidine-containing phosphotransfer) domain-containing protein
MAESDVIDRTALDALLEITGGDHSFLDDLIEAYLEDARELLATMRHAVVTENPTELRRAAHSLKSNSANFGALTLARLCQELEERAKNGVLEGASGRITQIQTEYARVQIALQTPSPTQ